MDDEQGARERDGQSMLAPAATDADEDTAPHEMATKGGGWLRAALAVGEPRVAVIASDPARRRYFSAFVTEVPLAASDVMLVDLTPGDLPVEFARPALLLTDDVALRTVPYAAGVLPRDAPAGQVAAALAAVAQGLEVRPRASGLPTLADPVRPVLTRREFEILALVGEGQSNKVVARSLGISAHTVKYHLEAVFLKLGVRTRAEAVNIGLRRGLARV